MTISSWLNFGHPAPPGRGLRRGENFWLRLTTASVQCLRLSERFFSLLPVLQKILIEAKQLDKQFCSWFTSDCIMTNLSTVISHVTVDEYRLQELSTEVALASRVDYDYEDDYEDVIAVNDDGDEIDFPPPGTVSFHCFTAYSHFHLLPLWLYFHLQHAGFGAWAACGLRGWTNRPNPHPGLATKPSSVGPVYFPRLTYYGVGSAMLRLVWLCSWFNVLLCSVP